LENELAKEIPMVLVLVYFLPFIAPLNMPLTMLLSGLLRMAETHLIPRGTTRFESSNLELKSQTHELARRADAPWHGDSATETRNIQERLSPVDYMAISPNGCILLQPPPVSTYTTQPQRPRRCALIDKALFRRFFGRQMVKNYVHFHNTT
jgi:hypothetical protein